jgi:hypothetical protein
MKLCTLLLLFSLPAFSASDSFSIGIQEYNQGNVESALSHFQAVEGTSAELDYNIGNTMMRLGRTSEAIAHYRRAQWLAPGDADIQANLELAAEQLSAPVPKLPLTRSLTGWWTPGTWQSVFISLCWVTAGIGFGVTALPRLRPLAFWTLPPAAVLLLISALGTWASLPSRFSSEAVVAGPQGITRFEPLPDATEQHSLPGGSVVRITGKTRNWVQVETDDARGWMKEEELVRL